MCREECSGKEKQILFKAIQSHTILLKYPEAILLPSKIDTNSIITNNQNSSRLFIANLFGG